MKIEAIRVGGYANIGNTLLRPEDISAVIAPNGYGKSNLMRAISFGMMYLQADAEKRQQMLHDTQACPINVKMLRAPFHIELQGQTWLGDETWHFAYKMVLHWATETEDGYVEREHLLVKREGEQRMRKLMLREQSDIFMMQSSATGRCNREMKIDADMPAIAKMATTDDTYLQALIREVATLSIPNMNTLDNPESYFATDGRGIRLLGGMTISEYLYRLRETDGQTYAVLEDGIRQLIPNIVSFEPVQVTLGDGLSRIYDIRIVEQYNVGATSIRFLSSGSKRMVFLFTLCVAADKQGIPMMMLEEPENSVHPRMMENLLLAMHGYAPNCKILLTSHSPYLMRYLGEKQMYFGLPTSDGIARFERIRPNKLRYLQRYAGQLELTLGEFMFDFMLDMDEKIDEVEIYFGE